MERGDGSEDVSDNNSPGGQAGWLDEGLLVTASSDLAVRYWRPHRKAWRKCRLLNHLFTSSEHQWHSVNDFIDLQYCSIKCVYFDSVINMHL